MQHDIAIDHSSGFGFSMWPNNSLEPSPFIVVSPLSRLTSSVGRGSVHAR
jgi:hypothetical protein